MHINRSSRFVKYKIAYKLERVLDLVFLSAPCRCAGFSCLRHLHSVGRVDGIRAGLGPSCGRCVRGGLRPLCCAVAVAGKEIRDWRLEISANPQSPISNLQSPPIRFVFFSDLHLARIKKRAWVQRVVDAVNAQQPDVVLIGGDFSGVLGNNRFEDLLEPLKQLRTKHGTYAILGNHDHAVPGENHVPELEAALPQVNVRLLRNDCVQINESVQLLTADELWAGLDEVDGVFHSAAMSASSATSLQTSPRRVFMGHNPDLMLKMKPEYTADLFIFGHTHHGQIYIPFLSGLAVPIRSKFYRGTFHTLNGMVYVSAGAGEGNSPIRINTWPEIVVFEV